VLGPRDIATLLVQAAYEKQKGDWIRTELFEAPLVEVKEVWQSPTPCSKMELCEDSPSEKQTSRDLKQAASDDEFIPSLGTAFSLDSAMVMRLTTLRVKDQVRECNMLVSSFPCSFFNLKALGVARICKFDR
jgi:hypothetical protein